MAGTEQLARMFKVLSVETRVRMIRLLRPHPLCVNALARQLGITPAAVSQHLRVLRDAGVVSGVKQGFFVHYRLNKETLARWEKLAGDLLGDG
ncbi:MAG: metalloregulator ArsR/SmtB family transcription factor [Candidatus Aminicenantales bacterium]